MDHVEMYRDQNSAHYQAKFFELTSRGYRLASLSAYGNPANARYTSVWFKREGAPLVACHDKKAQEFQQFANHWTAQGYRMTMITATGANADAVFAAVFERSGSQDWFFKLHLVSGLETDPGTFQFE